MENSELQSRLSQIVTQWSLVLEAHREAGKGGDAETRGELLLRYSGAVYRYLLGATRDPDVAGELAQEFAYRFVRGDFHRAAPEKGKFRFYLKTALSRLITDHHRARQAGPRNLQPDAPEPADFGLDSGDNDREYRASWQAEFLEKTWQALEGAHPMLHAALRLRIESPDMNSTQMAEELTRRLEKPVNAALVRKSLERAHAKFAELLVEEVAHSLEDPGPEELERELAELDLLKYCRSVIEKKK